MDMRIVRYIMAKIRKYKFTEMTIEDLHAGSVAVDSVDAQHVVSDISLVVGGTVNLKTVTKTDDYTAADEVVILCDASSNKITITLPTAVGKKGRTYYVKKIDSSVNPVTIKGNGSQSVDGDSTQVATIQYTALTVISDGSNWHII